MAYSVRLTIFIVVTVLVAAALFLLFFYNPIRKVRCRHHPERLYYRKIAQIVRDDDFYLINTLQITEPDMSLSIDHLIGGDKFIYVIKDIYFEGGVAVHPADVSWMVYEKKGKHMIDNPLLSVQDSAGKLAMKSNLDPSFFIAIVVVNDDCFLSRFQNSGSSPVLVSLSKLRSVIASYEKKDVPAFHKGELRQTIQDFYDLYKDPHADLS